MSIENDNKGVQRRLTSWKEIAAYLGRNERTVKRWEAARGLPVRRVANVSQGSVFAYPDEIDAWMHGHRVDEEVGKPSQTVPEPEPVAGKSHKWNALIALILIAALTVVTFVYFIPRQQSSGTSSRTGDPVAANLYRAGLHAWQTRTPSGLSRAIFQFQKAVARDPRFAEAYVGLADAYNLEGEFTATLPDRAYPKAAEAARRAIAL